MDLEKLRLSIQNIKAWAESVNSKKLYWVTSGVFFVIYFYLNVVSLSVIESILFSAIGAAATPIFLVLIFYTIVFIVATLLVAIGPFFKWFIRWITK